MKIGRKNHYEGEITIKVDVWAEDEEEALQETLWGDKCNIIDMNFDATEYELFGYNDADEVRDTKWCRRMEE